MDTVGLFDTNSFSNKDIMNDIKNVVQNKLTEGVSLILFVFKQGRFTKEENETFKFIIKNFKNEISEISALIITGCDNEDEEGRKKIVEEFTINPVTKEIASFMGKGIHCVGFPTLTNMKQQIKTIIEEDMKKDITMLRNLAFNSSEMKGSKEILQYSFWEKCNIL